MRDVIKEHRVVCGTSFVSILDKNLPFKIATTTMEYVEEYPNFFYFGRAEYGTFLDSFFEHHVLTYTSEQAVIALDSLWQDVVKQVANVQICLDQHDASSIANARPDFTAMHQNAIVMKGEAKVTAVEMNSKSGELTQKFHKTAYKAFPKGCTIIPAVMTSNEAIALYAVQYFNKKFTKNLVKEYNVSNLGGRVLFAVDLFKILIWIVSQVEPVEGLHLIPDVRTKTPSGHHVTLLRVGLYKEFNQRTLSRIPMDILKDIYKAKLPNVEHGTVNCKTITITRVGSRLGDALRVRTLDRKNVYDQIERGLAQMHDLGYSHCDLSLDNIFVDSVEDGGAVFLGDLEFCRMNTAEAPTDTRRADKRAKTAFDLDNLQLKKLSDELNK